MKKILFFLSLMMVAFFTANAQLKDDVNDDGVVDMSDATTLIDHVLNGVNNGSSHIFIAHNVMIEMVRVEGGTFTMGATAEQASDAFSDELPTHKVTLSPFLIGKYEVSQTLWLAVMGENPSVNTGINLPVDNVTWNECQTFITKLNELTGKNFRLLTEAEWEYAARGGNKSKGYKYSGSNNLGDVAWYIDNSNNTSHAMGTKAPNELGIYDMTGNVMEWVSDWKGSYSSGAQTNPTGPDSGTYRVNRGGSYGNVERLSRITNRNSIDPNMSSKTMGLRLCLPE
ncbi:MAG: formylglycine-generating enzyme family protein [Bacteroidales bacterium]|jgi:formylglycine-generating enzyme required for sulfatase activity|nr:formylglycine-generating enzyme family protein [Bacteroidales bacterium]MDY4076989.1 formylglycine-generating enzyme family protein [Sodaliphilus sp.]MCI7585141.1 formylglycine-generating enzyme family protein [Bacteroidales bacterium]MCI7668660.1 formylglycine-generating enzyme family protein [Bacteroidales bacterium]MDD7051937.1 formylglycine-generating enzyme family protein [Bacteroidales bacterium]